LTQQNFVEKKSGGRFQERSSFDAELSRHLETQDRTPKIRESIDRVGIEGLRTLITLSCGRKSFCNYNAKVDIAIDLDENHKGIHMSRLVESINEVVDSKTQFPRKSFESLGLAILKELKRKHRYIRGQVAISTELLIPRRTPVSGKLSNEPYDVVVKVASTNGDYKKFLGVKVIGSTLCPHSLETTGGKAHAQRAVVELGLETDVDESIMLEELIDVCEKSLSSPTYTVLKTVDEAYLVEKMYSNPKFVEDVARECLEHIIEMGIKGKIRIKVTSNESIHKHDAVSEIERVVS
jgi:GTP cyclohydrolase-4